MFRKYIIPLIALGGVAFAVFTVVWGDKPPPAAPPVSEAPWSPYPTFVAGSGLVEASTENISLGTHVAGIVAKIYVQIGSDVKAGDPLFTIDDRAEVLPQPPGFEHEIGVCALSVGGDSHRRLTVPLQEFD